MADQLTTSLLSLPELVDLLGESRRTVERRIENGEIPVAHKGPGPKGHYVFAVDQVRHLIAERTEVARAEIRRLERQIERAEQALR